MDLPPIAEDLDEPLPESPDPSLTPYRIARRDPTTGELTFTTGYGQRRAIAPPQQGAVPMPDMGGAYAAAFQHLPVDQALKTVEVAMQFQGQRGYMRDVAAGLPMAQAYAKWAPMLHPRTATGTAEAMRLTTPSTPSVYQKFQMARQTLQDQAARAPKLHFSPKGEIIQQNPDGTFEVKRAATPDEPKRKVLSPTEKHDEKADEMALEDIEYQIKKAGPPHPAGFLRASNTNHLQQLNAQAQAIRTRMDARHETTPSTTAPAAPDTTTPKGPPKVGDVVKGYRFKGGNPRLKENWEKV